MKWLLKRILRVVGPANLLRMTWEEIYPYLESLAKKTDTQIDDKALAILDNLVNDLIGDIS